MNTTKDTTMNPSQQSKHTPGPWKFSNGFIHGVGENNATIAEMKYNRDGHNARLIAAAPELLDELRKAQKLLVLMVDEALTYGGSETARKLQERYNRMNVVIGKATQD